MHTCLHHLLFEISKLFLNKYFPLDLRHIFTRLVPNHFARLFYLQAIAEVTISFPRLPRQWIGLEGDHSCSAKMHY